MTGSASVLRGLTCESPTHPCDDFALRVDRGSDDQAQLLIEVAPSDGAELEIAVYPPGCPTDLGPSPSCLSVYDATRAKIIGAASGDYLIRLTCDQCVSATYHATATLSHASFELPPAGDPSPAFVVQQLPQKETGLTSYGEPGISINKLGHVIVNTFGPTVWISTDNGHSWGPPLDSVDPTPCAGLSGDADAVVSDDDTYYADNLCLAGPTNLSYSSHDTGQSWNGSQGGLPTLPGAATDSDRQWYSLDPTNAAVVYFSYHDAGGPNIWVNKSTDHGQTWSQQTPITLTSSNFTDAISNVTSPPLVDPSDPNRVLVFYSSGPLVPGQPQDAEEAVTTARWVWLAESHDGGATWGDSTLVYDAGTSAGEPNNVANIFPVGAVDSAGNAYVVFGQRDGGQTETHLYLLALPKGAGGKARAVQVDQGGLRSSVMPWITAGDPGRVAVSWYGSIAADKNDPTAEWSEMFAVTSNALSPAPHFAQTRVSGALPNHAADICTDGVVCTGNRNLADFQRIAVDPCGHAQLVWTDDLRTSGVTMHARQTAGPSLRTAGCPADFAAGLTPTSHAVATPRAARATTPPTGDSGRSVRTALAGLTAAFALALAAIARHVRTGRIRP